MGEEKEELIISQVFTNCKNCVFAEYKDDVQESCKLGKLEDYKKAGVKIVEIEEEGKVFSLVDGRFCMFFRTAEIMDKHPKSSWEDLVTLETKIPYHVILFVEENDSFSTIKTAIKNLKDQEIQPNLVTIINKQHIAYLENPESYIKPSTMLELLSNASFHKHSLRNMYDPNITDRAAIDLVFDNSHQFPYPFYAVFRADFDIPKDFSKCLNDAVFIKMMQLGFVKPYDDLSGMIVNRTAHKKHSGNCFNIPLEDKILEFEDEGSKFIFNIKDVCPNIGK